MDDGRRDQHVQKQPEQGQRLVDPAAHLLQVPGEGEHKADFGQLRGLEGHAADTVPAVVGGAAGVVADGDEPEVQIVQKQRGRDQAPGQHGV